MRPGDETTSTKIDASLQNVVKSMAHSMSEADGEYVSQKDLFETALVRLFDDMSDDADADLKRELDRAARRSGSANWEDFRASYELNLGTVGVTQNEH